jgi:DNA-binding transcriptional regulator LsrR (DeoR family)
MAADHVVFEAARLFIECGLPVREIAALMGCTREQVYPMIGEAARRGYVTMRPPSNALLEAKLSLGFRIAQERIRVVDTHPYGRELIHKPEYSEVLGPDSGYPGRAVAAVAADLCFRLIEQVGRDKWIRTPPDPVRIGLGPGRANLDFCLELARLVEGTDRKLILQFIAISAGGPADFPQFSPNAFFPIFPKHIANTALGFVASPVVTQADYEELVRSRPTGFREPYELRDEIDIVISSMGDMADEHDLLRLLLEKCRGKPSVETLIRRKGWVGNFQYRPYTETGWTPDGPKEFRATTLFELDDFVRMRKSAGRHVILMARECARCQRDRGLALYPLMKDGMRVWSEVVMDVETARTLLHLLKTREGVEVKDEDARARTVLSPPRAREPVPRRRGR